MVDGLDVVSIGIQQVRAVVAGMVVPLAGRTVVPSARCQTGPVESSGGRGTLGLQGQMGPPRRRAIVADEELVREEVVLPLADDVAAERLQLCPVEASGRFDVRNPDVDVIDEPAVMKLHHACPFASDFQRSSLGIFRVKRLATKPGNPNSFSFCFTRCFIRSTVRSGIVKRPPRKQWEQ